MINLSNLTYQELARFVTETLNEPKFRAKQIFGWIYGGPTKDGSFRSGAQSFDEMNNLPKTLREKLTAKISLSARRRQRDRKRVYALQIRQFHLRFLAGGLPHGLPLLRLDHRRPKTESDARRNRRTNPGRAARDRTAYQPCGGDGYR